MTTFVFSDLVNEPPKNVVSAALGVNAAGKLVDADVGKPVKLAASNNYVVVSVGDEIEGFVYSIEPFTVNTGFGFGGVQKNGRKEAKVASDQGVTPMAVGDYVVGGAGNTVGTANLTQVKTGAATKYLWRCIRIISGTGVAGDSVLLERQ